MNKLNKETLILSKFAFGTSGIMGSSFTDRGRLKLLDIAFDRGVTHFDTAPLYGQGDAEKVLGKFISTRREHVTVATKFGLKATPFHPLLGVAKPLVRALNRRLLEYRSTKIEQQVFDDTALMKLVPIDADAVDPGMVETLLQPNELVDELDTSLRKLKTDYVDLFLLHEVSLSQLNDEFVEQLLDLKKQGKALNIGLATSRSKAKAIQQRYSEMKSVTQVASTPFVTERDSFSSSETQLILHSCVQTDFARMRYWVQQNRIELSKFLGLEPTTRLNVNAVASKILMLRAASKTAEACLLFSSSNPEHIYANTKATSDEENLLAFVLTKLRSG